MNKFQKFILVVLGSLVVIFMLAGALVVFAFNEAKSGNFPTEKPVSGLQYADLKKCYSKTTAQWEKCVKDAVGQRIEWTGYVRDANESLLTLGPNQFLNDNLDQIVLEVPLLNDLNYSVGQEVKFRGDIRKIEDAKMFIIVTVYNVNLK